jgi:hypothetical protein
MRLGGEEGNLMSRYLNLYCNTNPHLVEPLIRPDYLLDRPRDLDHLQTHVRVCLQIHHVRPSCLLND